jgi:hypothetical protein
VLCRQDSDSLHHVVDHAGGSRFCSHHDAVPLLSQRRLSRVAFFIQHVGLGVRRGGVHSDNAGSSSGFHRWFVKKSLAVRICCCGSSSASWQPAVVMSVVEYPRPNACCWSAPDWPCVVRPRCVHVALSTCAAETSSYAQNPRQRRHLAAGAGIGLLLLHGSTT